MSSVKPNPKATVLHQLCELWEVAAGITLREGTPDSLCWRWIADGKYKAASAYHKMFQGAIPTNDKEII